MQNLLLAFTASLLLVSCNYVSSEKVRGSGTMKTETRTISSFEGVRVSGAIELYVTQDSVTSLRIETDDNLMEYITTSANGQTLEISEKRGYDLKPSTKIKVYVSGPTFRNLDASGACEIHSRNQIKDPTQISIDITGASEVELDVNAPTIEADLTGASDIVLRGITKTINAEATGASTIKCYDLMAEHASVSCTGASSAQVFASVQVDASATGASDIRYRGNAKLSKSVSGAGSVSKD